MGDTQSPSLATPIPTPAQLADELDRAMSLFWESFAELEPEEVETATLPGGWTPKALVAHVAFWDDFHRQRMEAALAGTSRDRVARPVADNDVRAQVDADRPWAAVHAAALTAREQLVAFARRIPPEALTQEYPEGERMLSVPGLLRHLVRHTQEHRREIQTFCGSRARWGKAGLRKLMEDQYTNLMDGAAGLDEATMLAAQVCGFWSIRDVLAHVLGWNEYVWRVVEAWPAPDPGPLAPWAWQPGDTWDTLNARLLARYDALNVIELADGLVTYHRRMLRALDKASDAELDGVGYAWGGAPQTLACFVYEAYVHVAEHAAQVWAYRAGLTVQESARNRSDDA